MERERIVFVLVPDRRASAHAWHLRSAARSLLAWCVGILEDALAWCGYGCGAWTVNGWRAADDGVDCAESVEVAE